MPWHSYCSFALQNGPFAEQLYILPAISQTFILSLLVTTVGAVLPNGTKSKGNLHDATWWSTIGLKLWHELHGSNEHQSLLKARMNVHQKQHLMRKTQHEMYPYF